MVKPGSIVHVELHSADPAKSKAFYAEIFGWKFTDIPEMEYITFQAPSNPSGGLMRAIDNRVQVLNYILSADIDRDMERIQRAGGTILQQKMEIPQMGWWAMFQEPGGTVQALYQNLRPPRQAAKRARPKPRKPAKKSTARRRRK